MTSTLNIQTTVATDFIAVFEEINFAQDVAPRMTCSEVNAVIGMLRAVGGDQAADAWHTAHAAADEAGDEHYQPTVYVVPVDPMDDLQCDSCQ